MSIVTASLVMLTGWVGQISVGHAALVGVGAYSTGWAVSAWHMPFPVNLFVAGSLAAAVAAVLGGVALRVRGLYLAVATLIFSWMVDAFLVRIEWFVRHSQIDPIVVGDPDGVPRFDFSSRPTMFYISWGIAILVLFIVSNLRDSGTGRAFFAIRGSEIGAASLGVDVTRYKLLAFTFSGFLAGVAGSMIMLDSRSLSPDQFQFTTSLFYLSVVVVGGLTSLGGGVVSAILFAGLNEVFFRVRALGDALDLVSALMLAVVLLAYRSGLAAVPDSLRRLADWVGGPLSGSRAHGAFGSGIHAVRAAVRSGRRDASRLMRLVLQPFQRTTTAAYEVRQPVLLDGPALDATRPDATDRLDQVGIRLDVAAQGDPVGDSQEAALPASERTNYVSVVLPPERDVRTPLLEAAEITVRFGGLVAVDNVSLSVREHEIVGLIGPNGAGKTTLFNAIAGLNRPTTGTVALFGQDVTALPVHKRAELGVARTFQAIQLFPELDVFDNLLVATHVHNDTGFLRHLAAGAKSLRTETGLRERVASLIDELDMGEIAHRRTRDLPFGVLRQVEVARALVTGFPLIMLDEPASGLDNSETDRLAEMLLTIRARGITLWLIEHDVRMVTSICDYVYVINRGMLIAEGSPNDIKRNSQVIAAYLGKPQVQGKKRDRTSRRRRARV